MIDTPLVIFGCGYIGGRVARAALAAGRKVRVCSRDASHLAALAELGAEVVVIDAQKPRQFSFALNGLRTPTVLYSIPPIAGVSGGETLRRAAMASLNAGARCFIYLASAGVYGDRPTDEWVDEDSTFGYDDAPMQSYHADEGAVESAGLGGLRTIILRLTAVYGVGRGVRMRLRKGDYKLLDEGKHWISRVHVDDLVGIIFAAEERAPQSSMYNVADDKPTTQLEHVSYIAKRLGVPLPPSAASFAPGLRRVPHRGRAVKNDKLKRELEYTFKYPSYVEGEAQVDLEEGGASAPAPAPAPASAPAPVPAPDRPPMIRAASTLKSEVSMYSGTTEPMGVQTELAEPFGFKRLGMHLLVLPPGERASYPHGHQVEEEIAYVLDGTPDAWVDGKLHRLAPGDVFAFPPGTGMAHTVINNSAAPARLLVAGERREDEKVFYPLNPERQALNPAHRWNDPPAVARGDHDGLPDAKRKK